jgi:actin-related protein
VSFSSRFAVPALLIASSPIACVLSTGKTTGLSIESGDTVTQTSAVHDGQLIPQSALRINFGGRDVTDHLRRLLTKYNGVYTATEAFPEAKEKFAVVREKDQRGEDPPTRKFELPDGQVLSIGEESYQCTEPYFAPSIIAEEHEGLHHLINYSINRCKTSLFG